MAENITTLRELRLARGITLPDLAEQTGTAKGDLSKIERGRQVASAVELNSLASVLDTLLENRMQVVEVKV